MGNACALMSTDDGLRQLRGPFREQALPVCVRGVLDAARAARPDSEVTCIAFHTVENGRKVMGIGADMEVMGDGRTGLAPSRLHPKDVLVLSVTVTETTFDAVRTVTHVLVAVAHPRIRGCQGIPV